LLKKFRKYKKLIFFYIIENKVNNNNIDNDNGYNDDQHIDFADTKIYLGYLLHL